MHNHNHSSSHTTSNIRLAFLLNLSFTIIEIVGGIMTNSLAILSDALHDLGDSLSLGLSWYLEKYSTKERDAYYTYGYARFSLLSALINGVVLICGSILILTTAVPRLFNPVQPDTSGMVLLAILGIVFNGIAALRLYKGSSLNQRMVGWHLFEDVVGWFGVLVIAIVMRFYHIPILDGLFSIVFTLYIMFNVVKVLKQTLKILLQGRPEHLELEILKKDLQQISNLISCHDLRLWSLDEEQLIMSLHVVVPEHSSKRDIMQVKKDVLLIAQSYEISHVTIEIEYQGESCSLSQS